MSSHANQPTCFIAMPISTPEHLVKEYDNDSDHFAHVLSELFIPAIEAAGMKPITPVSQGAENIHAEVIEALQSADLVLVDLSSLNPNVFFEFGVRTSLNKPTCPVREEKTTRIPFDTTTLNTHMYRPQLQSWITKTEIPKLTEHLRVSLEKSKGKNALWKYFGFKQTAEVPKAPHGTDDKLDLLISLVERQERTLQHADRLEETSSRGVARLSDSGGPYVSIDSSLHTTNLERLSGAIINEFRKHSIPLDGITYNGREVTVGVPKGISGKQLKVVNEICNVIGREYGIKTNVG